MAIGLNLLTGGASSTDGTSFATASVAPSADALVLIFVTTSETTTAPTVTVSGASLSWVEVLNTTDTAPVRRLTVLRAMSASPGSGALTITCSASALSCHWSVFELTGVTTSGTDGSGAVVQSVSGFGVSTSGSLTLASPATTDNRPVSGWTHRVNEAKTPRTNWTEIHDQGGGGPNGDLETQWRSDAFETTASASWTTSQNWAGIALEVQIGGTAHSKDLAESVGGTDALTRLVAYARALAETVGGSEAATRVATYARALAETAPATDAVTSVRGSARALADSASTTDAIARAVAYVRGVAESVVGSDAIARAGSFSRALADSAPATDAITSVRGPARSIADAAPATDANARVVTYGRALAETAPATDALTRASALSRSLVDNAPATDAVTAVTGLSRSLGDSAPATDAITRLVAYARALADNAPATDAISTQVIGGAQNYSRSLSDSAPATDSLLWFRNYVSPTRVDIEATLDTARESATSVDIEASATSATVPV